MKYDDIPGLDLPRLIIPESFMARRNALMKWFRDIDNRLTRYVEEGVLNIDMAQTYYRMKVEHDVYLSMPDKQLLANESKLYKIPHPTI